MPQAKENTYTTKDIYELPDRKRAELINGQIYDMTPPNRRHQKLVMNLSAVIYNFIHGNNGSCEVYPTPFAVFLNKYDHNYLEPDVSVIFDTDNLMNMIAMELPTESSKLYPQPVNGLNFLIFFLNKKHSI